jgi:hypothetical protein
MSLEGPAMDAFAAIVLVCLRAVAPAACDEGNAVDVLSTRVANELSCTMGWQEVIARSALGTEVGSQTYLKTLCRRVRNPDR